MPPLSTLYKLAESKLSLPSLDTKIFSSFNQLKLLTADPAVVPYKILGVIFAISVTTRTLFDLIASWSDSSSISQTFFSTDTIAA